MYLSDVVSLKHYVERPRSLLLKFGVSVTLVKRPPFLRELPPRIRELHDRSQFGTTRTSNA